MVRGERHSIYGVSLSEPGHATRLASREVLTVTPVRLVAHGCL
jgi:hypothetical protein